MRYAPFLSLKAAGLALGMLAAPAITALPQQAQAASSLRIAISLSDFPLLWGAPDAGFEGVRFGGYTVFDSLIAWDLTSTDKPSRLIPSLAESWTVDPNKTRWTFKLREAKFHDGTPWNADAALWNLDAFTNSKSPAFNATRSATARSRTISIAGFGKIDDRTIYIDTKEPNSFLTYELSTLFFVSPTQFEKMGGDWQKFAVNPVGTGPYKFNSLRQGQELVLDANKDYWNKARVPKHDRLVLTPVPDANTRVAALRSGQIDLIDTLAADAIAPLKAAGFNIVSNVYPHTWIWRISFTEDSAFKDVRVRRAVNLAINREDIAEMLSGTGIPAKGFAPPDAPWFGKPKFDVKYDPEGAKKLLAEAGYGPSKPVNLKVIIAPSGGGQMVPIAMNEAIQENLRAVGVNVTYDVRDFTAMITMLRNGAKVAQADGINIAMTMQDPGSGIVSSYRSIFAPPAGGNWGFYNNPAFDEAWKAAMLEFETDRQEAAMAKVNEILTEDAAAIMVVHDTSPRALSPKLKGFVQARNWYQDFTTIEVLP